MSVALLSQDKPVEICDELEAFFYVLLYHAIRYLRSNLDDNTTANYLHEFFEQYTRTEQGYVCGPRKLYAIICGQLTVTAFEYLTFDPAMNDLILALLGLFQSNYMVNHFLQEVEEEQRQTQAHTLLPPPAPPGQPLKGSAPSKSVPMFTNYASHTAQRTRASKKAKSRHRRPPPEVWSDRELIQSHDYLLQLLAESVLENAWPKDDKVGDRIPKTWTRPSLASSAQSATTMRSAATSNKRARFERLSGIKSMTLPLEPSQQVPPQSPPRRHADSLSDVFWKQQTLNESGPEQHVLS